MLAGIVQQLKDNNVNCPKHIKHRLKESHTTNIPLPLLILMYSEGQTVGYVRKQIQTSNPVSLLLQ